MTQQEAFNHVWKTFIIEGAPRSANFSKVLGLDLEFLRDLQNCHDNAESGEYFHISLHEHLEWMALRYGLKVPA
jgi:hypothetical protein